MAAGAGASAMFSLADVEAMGSAPGGVMRAFAAAGAQATILLYVAPSLGSELCWG